jgi:hypothetical protein
VRERARERKQKRAEERKQAEQAAEWERFMQAELRELELRKGGQLAKLLGEPLPGEPPAALERLASADQSSSSLSLSRLSSSSMRSKTCAFSPATSKSASKGGFCCSHLKLRGPEVALK